MKITVMSRAEAVLYCYFPHTESTRIISISDPRMQYTNKLFCSPENKVVSILRLWFADADQPGRDVYCHDTDYHDMMSDEDAARLADFVFSDPTIPLIVHCDAGISRSAGVAAAILKHFTGDDSLIFDNPKYQPNMWCYRKTLNTLIRQDKKERDLGDD